MRCLFLYPNNSSELRIPLAISILISAMRSAGHEVRLFDSTFYGEFHTDNEAMAKMGTHKQTDLNALVGETRHVDIKQDFDNTIRQFKPDVICVSIVERNFHIAKRLLSNIDIPIIAGGIMPTIASDFMIGQPWIDMICVGEGEGMIIDYLNGNFPFIKNLRSKDINNSLRQLIDLNRTPEQDWSDWDKRHLLKPFMGKVYRGGAFELSRGCFKSCTFCVAPKLRQVQAGLGRYHRTKAPEVAIREIEHKIQDYNLNMIAFSDTDFLSGVPKPLMGEFLSLYSDRVRLPFTIQSSVATLLDEEILALLRKAQCCAISVGVESGSERIQRDVLKKVIPTEMIKKAFDLCRKYELRVTANYMIGLPTETEGDIRQTIDLNRLVNPPSIAVTFFTPFIGTELYSLCVDKGFYKPFDTEYHENIYEYPPLSMPQLSQERIKEMVKEFTEDFRSYQQDISIL